MVKSMRYAENIPSKNEDEQPVPLSWRPVLSEIADRLANRDYTLTIRPGNVSPIDDNLAALVAHQIGSYGGELTSLLDESWDRAVYLWMGEHWEVLVDLCTREKGVSDLGLFVKVFEQAEGFRFEVWSVHVP